MITVLPGEEGSDFDLDASYYVIIGTGGNPGNEQSANLTQCNVSITTGALQCCLCTLLT